MINSPELKGISSRVLGYPFRGTVTLGEGSLKRICAVVIEWWKDGSGRVISGVCGETWFT